MNTHRTVTAADLITEAQGHVGEPYRLGASPSFTDPHCEGPWDCAEFCSWLVYQTTGRVVGCVDSTAPVDKLNAFTGAWHRDALAGRVARVIPVATAMVTPGAFLLRLPVVAGDGTRSVGHIALSAGGGRTVEAQSPRTGVCESRSIGRRWDVGVEVEGVQLGAAEKLTRAHQVGLVLRVGSRGPEVRQLQVLLGLKTIDGVFGTVETLPAVLAFQRRKSLVVDGEVAWKPPGETRLALEGR